MTLATGAAWAEGPEQSAAQLVEFECGAIKSTYYDPKAGERLCKVLQSSLRSGELAALPERDRLKRVTALLREKTGDRHFYIGLLTAEGKPAATRPEGKPEFKPNWNGGFTQIRVLEGNIGYIKWDRSLADDGDLEKIVNGLKFVHGVDALIFDITENPGGDGRSSGFVNRHLFESDDYQNLLVKRCRGETQWKQSEVPYNHAPGAKFHDTPVYVMVSGKTGSAAEYFALILQQMKRATILGKTTAGAGNPVVQVKTDKYFAYIPICQITTKDGVSIEGKGVVPDVPLQSDDWLEETRRYILDRRKTE
ncbi:S41 family peptidase [Lysobacter sp. 5GHs7-4]|uniref:S41 family peptidase n=1 Tax=Lysobacter sp. 5GHs7-4 TaxID=2904253 RepID=UPI001E2B2AE9|nr:S41 family peptidase [Lysobacter sp. 5GHs7-4]UHQ24476.1 S41 family peptidase [Lysobacter sp. 5GHs7-4]